MNINLQELSESEFNDHVSLVYAEQARRSELASIPGRIQEMANSFEALGGSKEELITKINEQPAPVESENVQTPPTEEISTPEVSLEEPTVPSPTEV